VIKRKIHEEMPILFLVMAVLTWTAVTATAKDVEVKGAMTKLATPYRSFWELAREEVEGKDYQIKVHLRDERVLIMAPHGGRIEPTTSMIAEAIAGENYSFYSFEGLKEEGNGILHIESHLFDEPRALEAVKKADVVVTVHGQLDQKEQFIMVGGLNVDLRSDIRRRLEAAGFETRTPPEGLQGIDPENICNRGRLKGGVQLEVSRKERDLLRTDQERLTRFAGAIREAIQRFLRK
jgi:phage replication-related protein YjqB (UPF0714/DUF867 family)